MKVIEQHLLVVATQKNAAVFFEHEPFDDALRVGPAVDVVAEKDELRLGGQLLKQRFEFFQAAMDVAD
jgi:hypothetical protein